MAEPIPLPTPYARLLNEDGTPTQELLEILAKIKEALDDHESRLDAGAL